MTALSSQLIAELSPEVARSQGLQLTGRFDQIPSGWVAVKSGDLCTYITSGSRDWKKYYCSKGALFIRTQDINKDRLDLSNVARVDLPVQVEGKRSLVEPGDLLITITGANVGKVALVPSAIPEAYVSQSVGLLKLADKRLGPFLHYYLQAEHVGRRLLMAMVYGMGRPVLSLQNLREIPVILPPLSEQHRIVAEIEKQLTRLDAGVASLKRVRTALNRYRASVLKAACEGRLVPTEAELIRQHGTRNAELETGETLLRRILAERRKNWAGHGKYREPAAPSVATHWPLPTGWTWATPDHLAAPESNSICAGPFGTIFKAKDFRPEGVPIIFLRHVGPGRYLTHKPGFMDTKRWDELFRTYSVYGGELLITKLGEPPGVCAVYPKNIGPAMVTPDVIKMSVDESAASSKFLMHYFNSEVARRITTGVAFGTTRLRLTLPLFRGMPIPLPPLAERSVSSTRWSGGCQLSRKLRGWWPPILNAPNDCVNRSCTAHLQEICRAISRCNPHA